MTIRTIYEIKSEIECKIGYFFVSILSTNMYKVTILVKIEKLNVNFMQNEKMNFFIIPKAQTTDLKVH